MEVRGGTVKEWHGVGGMPRGPVDHSGGVMAQGGGLVVGCAVDVRDATVGDCLGREKCAAVGAAPPPFFNPTITPRLSYHPNRIVAQQSVLFFTAPARWRFCFSHCWLLEFVVEAPKI